MKKTLAMIAVAAAILGFSASVQANPINGSLNFTGGIMTYNSTAVTSFGGTTTVAGGAVAPTGDYIGTQGATVTFVPGGFTFSPLGIVNPLWTFSVGGVNYSFALNSVTSVTEVGGPLPSLHVEGWGMLHIDGGFTDTTGFFSLSSTGTGSSFGFVAANVAVPDGGNTLMLLGSALSVLGFGVFRKSRKA